MVTSSDQLQHPPSPLAELSGTVLERRYELGRVLGAGGMGAVFEARHLRLDRPVAIKILRPVFAGHDQYIERFLREAKAASKIRHRNVVEILDYGESGGLVYSVMEFLVGQDLDELLRAQLGKRLPWSRVCDLLVQIASGLKAAHGQGVIHRDVKPANCFLTDEDGEPLVKLLDFGIAKLEDTGRGHTLTATAQVLGTPSYIAPELARTNHPASPRSDMYSLGVLAYRMLTGCVPFTADTVFELLRRACFDPVPPLRDRVPELPPAVESFVLELLAKEPDDRPADMLAVRTRLLELSEQIIEVRAVEIPTSSALPPGRVTSRPPDSTEDTTTPRDAGADGGARPEALEVGNAAAPPLPAELERPLSQPPSAPRTVVVATVGTQWPAHDATFSRSDETMLALGEATLRLGRVESNDRPHRKGASWLTLAGAMAVVVVGVGALPSMLDASAKRSAAESPERAASGAGRTPAALARVEPGDREPPPAARVAPSPAAIGDHVDEGSEPEVGTPAMPIRDPTPTMSPVREPVAATRAMSLPDESRKSPRRTTKSTPRPTEPPPDPGVVERLERRIASKCAKAMEDEPVTASFFVTPSGGLMGLNVVPRDAAGQCAIEQIQRTKFRPRSKNTPIKFIVE